MLSPSGTVIAPSGQVTQVLKVSSLNNVSYKYLLAVLLYVIKIIFIF